MPPRRGLVVGEFAGYKDTAPKRHAVFETVLIMPDENKIRDAADAIKGVVQAVPVYQDVAQPAAKEIGTALQTVAKTVHIALAPISGLVWGYDKIKEFVATSVAKRLEKTPPEQIKTPLPQIAGPALEALKYTGHDENLREMFAKLIATAMDENKAEVAHPSFVEIIRQINSDEAKICKYLKSGPLVYLINLEEVDGGRRRTLIRNYSNLGYEASCQLPLNIQVYLNNLKRLGIIDCDFDGGYLEDKPYEQLEKHPAVQEAVNDITKEKHTPHFERGSVIVTTFGRRFLEACID